MGIGRDAGCGIANIVERHAVPLLENHREFEGIDRIESKALNEERCIGLDFGGGDVLECQSFNDELLQLAMECILL